MKLTLKIPIVKQSPTGSWERFQVDGSLEVESTSEDYSDLKGRANALLAEISAEYQLVRESVEIENQIDRAKQALANIQSDFQVAQNQLNRLTLFLKSLGVDAKKHYLAFDEQLKLRSADNDSDSDSDSDSDPIPY